MSSQISGLRELLRSPSLIKQQPRFVASGCRPLDRLLPEGGFLRGSLVEWFGGGAGSGAGILAMMAAWSACRERGHLVVVDRRRDFYPLAGEACRTDLQNTIVVHPDNPQDECWALDQALRCPHVSAVVAWPARLEGRAFRRLQLAAEQSGCLGLLVRPGAARNERSWARVRLLVSPRAFRRGWRLRVELLRCGGQFEKSMIELEIDDETGDIRDAHPRRLAAQLAGAALDSRKRRA